MSLPITAEVYDLVYARQGACSPLKDIDKTALKDDWIFSLEPTGFLRRSALLRYSRYISDHANQVSVPSNKRRLLDIGCGTGKVGLWLSKEAELLYAGIDFSKVAIRMARNNLSAQPVKRNATFAVADFTAINIREDSILVAFSLDAMYLASNPGSALSEVQRVLVKHGLLCFTVYTGSKEEISEWTALLLKLGFTIDRCENVSFYWRKEMKKKHLVRWEKRKLIKNRMGFKGDAELSVTASMLGKGRRESYLDNHCRFEILATKT